MNDDDIERRISRHLQQQSRLMNVGAPSLISVTRRAAQRRGRRRATLGVVTTAAVSIGTIAGIQALSRSGASPARPSSTTVPNGPGPSTPQLQPVDPSLVWNTVRPDSTQALGYTNSLIHTADGFLAFSTTPGHSDDAVGQLYRSADGITWQPTAPIDGLSSFTAVTASDNGRLFTFATAPATAAGLASEPSLRVSADTGATWQPLNLPLDLGDLSGLNGNATVAVTPVAVAAGAAGVIAVAGVTLRFSDEIRRNYPNIVGWTADGLQVASPCDPSSATTIVEFGPGATTAQIATTVSGVMVGSTTPSTRGGEVAASTTAQPEVVTAPVSPDCPSAAQGSSVVPWSAVGIDPATAARLIGRPRVFVSADGEQFTAAATPAVGNGEGNGQVRALSTSDGYALLVTSANQANGKTDAQLLTSTDGMAWTAHEILTRYPVAFGELADGSLAVTGSDAGGQASSDVLRNGVVQSTRLAGLLEHVRSGQHAEPRVRRCGGRRLGHHDRRLGRQPGKHQPLAADRPALRRRTAVVAPKPR